MNKSIVFVTREPVVHQLGGSTTYALNLLEVLRGFGAGVTVVTTNAFSCSPLLWFRPVAALPEGVKLEAPGFLRLGSLYLNLFSLRAWGRAFTRLGTRRPWLQPVSALAQRLFGARLFTNAWDLTPPTPAEKSVARETIQRTDAASVVVNYAFWAPLLEEYAGSGRRRVILMHDLLSARVRQFLESGTPLDSPLIEEEQEMQWLDSADCVLAAQAREAEIIAPQIKARVLVQPMVYRPHTLPGTPQPGRCLFVGANIVPNQTGLRWFVDDVWPLVLARNPQARLAVVGTICSWLEDGIPGVEKLSIVPSIESEYARATACVVPLRLGSGIKIKLVEALSYGKPVVATSIGVQGLEQWVQGAVDVCDDPSSFGEAVLALLADPALRKAREEAGLRLIAERFSADALLDTNFVDCLLGA